MVLDQHCWSYINWYNQLFFASWLHILLFFTYRKPCALHIFSKWWSFFSFSVPQASYCETTHCKSCWSLDCCQSSAALVLSAHPQWGTLWWELSDTQLLRSPSVFFHILCDSYDWPEIEDLTQDLGIVWFLVTWDHLLEPMFFGGDVKHQIVPLLICLFGNNSFHERPNLTRFILQ